MLCVLKGKFEKTKYLYTMKTNLFIAKSAMLLFVLLISNTIYSQTNPQFQWVRTGGSSGNLSSNWHDESIRNIGTDDNGNVYTLSMHSSSGVRIDSLYFTGFGWDDFSVFSYDCQGNFRWVRRFGNVLYDGAEDIIVDKNGNSYITGGVWVSGSGDANFGDTVIPANSTFNKANFLIKLDSLGNTQWLSLPGPDNVTGFVNHRFSEIEFGGNGNPYVFAYFSDSCTYEGFVLPNAGNFVLEFDKETGALLEIINLRTKILAPNPGPYSKWCTMDEDDNIFLLYNVPLVGMLIGNDTLMWEPGVNGEYVILSYDLDGNLQWKRRIYQGVDGDTANISIDIRCKPSIDDKYLYIAGSAQNYPGCNFLGFPIENPIADGWSLYTRFYARFNKFTGELDKVLNLWHHVNIMSSEITTKNGRVYGAAQGGSMVILNGTDTIFPSLLTSPTGDQFPFVVEIDSSFTHFKWGKATIAQGPSRVQSIHADKNGAVYVGGFTNGSVSDSYGNVHPGVGSQGYYLAKVALDNDCECKGAMPTAQFLSFQNNELIVSGSLGHWADSMYWHWGDGDSSLYPIPGTSISHTYTTSGPHTVCLRAWNHCGMSESCLENLLSLAKTPASRALKLYPNPFHTELTIETTPEFLSGQLKIYSIHGQLLHQQTIEQTGFSIPTQSFPSGVYYLQIISKEGKQHYRKIVKTGERGEW